MQQQQAPQQPQPQQLCKDRPQLDTPQLPPRRRPQRLPGPRHAPPPLERAPEQERPQHLSQLLDDALERLSLAQPTSAPPAPRGPRTQRRQLPPRLPPSGAPEVAAPRPDPMDVSQAAELTQQTSQRQHSQRQQRMPPASPPRVPPAALPRMPPASSPQGPPASPPRVPPVVPHAGVTPAQREQEVPWEEKCLLFLQDEDPASALSSGQHMVVVRHAYEQLGHDQWAAIPWRQLKASLLEAAVHLFPAIDPDPRPWQVVPPRPRRVQRARQPGTPASTHSASPASRTGTTAHTPRSRSRSPPAQRRSSGRVRRPPGEWFKASPAAAAARPAAEAREGGTP